MSDAKEKLAINAVMAEARRQQTRDSFAQAALTGLLSMSDPDSNGIANELWENYARDAYAIADAMLDARGEEP